MEIYERLRMMRNDYASERGLKAFQVMTNETLLSVVMMKPVNVDEFRRIKGVIRKYEDDLASLMTPAIREWIGDKEVERRERIGMEVHEFVRSRKRDEDKAGTADFEVPLEDRDLYELLRRIRMDLARDAGWPPYCIMSNKALRAVTALKPLTVEDFRAVPGISARRRDKSGGLFVSAILEYLAV